MCLVVKYINSREDWYKLHTPPYSQFGSSNIIYTFTCKMQLAKVFYVRNKEAYDTSCHNTCSGLSYFIVYDHMKYQNKMYISKFKSDIFLTLTINLDIKILLNRWNDVEKNNWATQKELSNVHTSELRGLWNIYCIDTIIH